MSEKKPRVTRESGKVPKEIIGKKVKLVIRDTGAAFYDEDGNEFNAETKTISHGYQRQKNFKTLTQLFNGGGKNINKTLLEKYDVLYAIDTNVKKEGNETFTITCLVKLDPLDYHDGDDQINFNAVPVIEQFGEIDYPEQHGWAYFIEKIVDDLGENLDIKIGIIVDSDLDNLSKYNNGDMPIYNDIYLDRRITLLYSSADGGMDILSNKAIKIADKLANDYYKKIRNK